LKFESTEIGRLRSSSEVGSAGGEVGGHGDSEGAGEEGGGRGASTRGGAREKGENGVGGELREGRGVGGAAF
jgi:hypothetical protein